MNMEDKNLTIFDVINLFILGIIIYLISTKGLINVGGWCFGLLILMVWVDALNKT